MVWKLRTAASGPLLRGTANGQALIWNEDLDGWEAGEPATPNVYQFATLADLEAAFPAVGGVHTLDELAVYQFVGAGFDLAGNVIAVTGDGAIVEGQGATELTGESTLGLLRMQGVGQTLQNLRVRNTASDSSLDRCGVDCDGGLITLINCRLEAAGDGVGLVTQGNSNVVALGVEFRQGDLANVRYVAGNLTLVAPRFTGGAGPALMLDSSGGLTVAMSDSQCVANKTHGVLVDGNLVALLLSNCDLGAPLTAGIERTAGTVGACSVVGGHIGGAAGIVWADASIPTRGLMVVGVDISATTPFSGFAADDNRVNVKACVGSAGLLTETAIVP